MKIEEYSDKANDQGRDIAQMVHDITVDSTETFNQCKTAVQMASELKKEINQYYEPHVKNAHKVHKDLTIARKTLTDPLDQVIREGERKNGTYMQKLREETDRARREAEQDERDRIKAENEERAQSLEAAGMDDEAAEIRATERVLRTPNVEVYDLTQEIKQGTRTRTNWKFNIEDESKIPREYMIPDLKAIGAHGRSRKEKAEIPGVNFYPETLTK